MDEALKDILQQLHLLAGNQTWIFAYTDSTGKNHVDISVEDKKLYETIMLERHIHEMNSLQLNKDTSV